MPLDAYGPLRPVLGAGRALYAGLSGGKTVVKRAWAGISNKVIKPKREWKKLIVKKLILA